MNFVIDIMLKYEYSYVHLKSKKNIHVKKNS